jgi:hypothetical protein
LPASGARHAFRPEILKRLISLKRQIKSDAAKLFLAVKAFARS